MEATYRFSIPVLSVWIVRVRGPPVGRARPAREDHVVPRVPRCDLRAAAGRAGRSHLTHAGTWGGD